MVASILGRAGYREDGKLVFAHAGRQPPTFMMNWSPGTIALVAVICSASMVWVIRLAALRLNVLDRPNARSSHSVPTPRGGGAAIVVVSLAAAMLAPNWPKHSWLAFVVGGVLIALAGAIDDVRPLPVSLRLLAQLIAAGVAVLSLHAGINEAGTTASLAAPLSAGIEVIATVWFINLFNFMDGIDGLAATQAVFIFGTAAWLLARESGHTAPVTFIALAGASAGFLTWNFPPAKIFMGDVGSAFLGFAVASAAFGTVSGRALNIWVWLILSSPFVCDATVTLVTRALRGERVYQAHRSHVYQRLARRWRSHRAVTILYAAIDLGWCLPWAWSAQQYPRHALSLCLIAVLPQVLGAVWLGGGRPG